MDEFQHHYKILFQISNMDIDKYEPQSYRIPFDQKEKWKSYLENNGFVVVANYIQRQSCQKFVNQFWGIMEILSQGKLDRNDEKTYGVNQFYPPVLHGGMIQYVGHSKPQWELRKLCKPIFENLWNTNQLKTSFDGFCFMNGARKYEKRANNAFLHCDQSPLKNYLWSYQGIMTLTDSKQNQGGFVCVPQSHKFHHEYFEKKGLLNHKKDWYKFPEQEKVKQPLCYDIKLDTEAGDFILFDSRTFHCNTVPMSDCLRVCTYVCMLPKSKIEQRILQGRKRAVENKRTTSHHPGDGFRTFDELPNEAKNPQAFRELIGKVNNFQMSKEIQQLI